MGVVGAPHEPILTEEVTGAERGLVVLDRGVELPPPDLVHGLHLGHAGLAAVLPLPALVDPIEPMGQPAGVVLRHHELQLGEASADAVGT